MNSETKGKDGGGGSVSKSQYPLTPPATRFKGTSCSPKLEVSGCQQSGGQVPSDQHSMTTTPVEIDTSQSEQGSTNGDISPAVATLAAVDGGGDPSSNALLNRYSRSQSESKLFPPTSPSNLPPHETQLSAPGTSGGGHVLSTSISSSSSSTAATMAVASASPTLSHKSNLSITSMTPGGLSGTPSMISPGGGGVGVVQVQHSSSSREKSARKQYKVQKKQYVAEKKRAARELLSVFNDPSVIIINNRLKVRTLLKSWIRLYAVLKPGILILFKSSKKKNWVGTILLSNCELIERPSKKDGFCFKLFHPWEQSIWATKGPKGETMGSVTPPLPYPYLIFRAPTESDGKCWMDALELALRCSSLLIRTLGPKEKGGVDGDGEDQLTGAESEVVCEQEPTMGGESGVDNDLFPDINANEFDEEPEKHFQGLLILPESGAEPASSYQTSELDMDESAPEDADYESEDEEEEDQEEDDTTAGSTGGGRGSGRAAGAVIAGDIETSQVHPQTMYLPNAGEELGQLGDACQTEEVAEENKSIIWTLVKQVRPGMDLSKVVLPTFILEPRSFLDKLSDYYYHADLLSEAVKVEDPYGRMKMIIKWYMAGFYKKPKGLKKPYNPIIGETFRCCWQHPPPSNSRTFYLAEQISHHPPISAFYAANRKDGFTINASILAKSKYYGNSLSAIMDGTAKLTLLKRGEDYSITMPYAHCKGILIGTLSMEMGGKVSINCEKTGYKTEIEFKLKPFFSSGESANKIVGKIKLGHVTLSTLEGHWDQEITLTDKATGKTEQLWKVTPEVKASRLKRFTVPLANQTEFESEKLWLKCSHALRAADQDAATQEKWVLEEAQRQGHKERKATNTEWTPKYFETDSYSGGWVYKYGDSRPWDPQNDLEQFEHNYIIQTRQMHRTPLVRSTSIISVTDSNPGSVNKQQRPRSGANSGGGGSSANHHRKNQSGAAATAAGHSSSPSSSRATGGNDGGTFGRGEDDYFQPSSSSPSSSLPNVHSHLHSNHDKPGSRFDPSSPSAAASLAETLEQLNERMFRIEQQTAILCNNQQQRADVGLNVLNRDWYFIVILLLGQMFAMWLFR